MKMRMSFGELKGGFEIEFAITQPIVSFVLCVRRDSGAPTWVLRCEDH